MKLKLMMLVSLFAIGFAGTAIAGNVADTDADGVPDAFDNCGVPNGPAAGGCSAQQDFDNDGFGDSCDGDYDNNGLVVISDFTHFFNAFVAGVPIVGDEDADCNGLVVISDFTPFFNQFVKGTPGLP